MARTTRNPFPSPSPLDAVLLEELVWCARRCYDEGWSHGGAGNFSLRGRDGLVWQSPAGLGKGELDPATFIPIDLTSGEQVRPLRARQSAETPMHLGIYRAVPTAKTVVHTHPFHLVALSRAGRDLTFTDQEMQKHLGAKDHHETTTIPVVANPRRDGIAGMVEAMAGYVRPGMPMVVFAGHGVYAWGETPKEALAYIETAEFLCRTHAL